MGEQNVRLNKDESAHQAFMKALLAEVHALEVMLGSGMLESGVRRIGAEQEMFLVDRARNHVAAASAVAAIGAIGALPTDWDCSTSKPICRRARWAATVCANSRPRLRNSTAVPARRPRSSIAISPWSAFCPP